MDRVKPTTPHFFFFRIASLRHRDFRPSPSGLLHPDFVMLRLPPLKSEMGWTGELWSKTNHLNWQNLENSISKVFFGKIFILKKKSDKSIFFWYFSDFSKFLNFQLFLKFFIFVVVIMDFFEILLIFKFFIRFLTFWPFLNFFDFWVFLNFVGFFQFSKKKSSLIFRLFWIFFGFMRFFDHFQSY